MLPTDVLCSSYYPACPPGPVLKTNLFICTDVFSNILELSLKASSCFSRLPQLWFCSLEIGTMFVPSRPNTIHFRGIHHWKGEGLNQIIVPFCAPGCPDFTAGYSRELQTVNSRFKMVETGRCCPHVCEGTKPTGNTRPELGCENRGIDWAGFKHSSAFS